MAEYKVFFKAPVEKELKAIPKKDTVKIMRQIASLSINPRPPGCEKLTGQEKYRVRQGMHRIVYSIQDFELTVWIVRVANRKDVYRR